MTSYRALLNEERKIPSLNKIILTKINVGDIYLTHFGVKAEILSVSTFVSNGRIKEEAITYKIIDGIFTELRSEFTGFTCNKPRFKLIKTLKLSETL